MLLQKARKNPLILAVVGLVVIAALIFAWWTISPLFIRTTLVEGQNIEVPAVSSMSDKPTMEEPAMMEDAPKATATTEPTIDPTPEVMPTEKVADTAGMMEEATLVPTIAPTEESMAVVEPTATTTPEPAKPAGPVVLASGNFDHKDSVHYADGQALLVRDGDGNNVVRLQDLAAANGPDLYVYVTEHPDPANSDELHTGEHNLGTLKATNGSFSYTLDPSVDVSKIKSVVIYCKAFSVIFSTATLQVAEQ